MKKRSILAILLCVMAASVGLAETNMTREDGTTSWTSTGVTVAYATSNCATLFVTVQASGADMTGTTVVIEQSSNATTGWQPVATFINPTASSLSYSLPSMNFTRVNISIYGTGTAIAKIDGVTGGSNPQRVY